MDGLCLPQAPLASLGLFSTFLTFKEDLKTNKNLVQYFLAQKYSACDPWVCPVPSQSLVMLWVADKEEGRLWQGRLVFRTSLLLVLWFS